MKLITGKKYICKVTSYNGALDSGMCVTSWGQQVAFARKNVAFNLTHPNNNHFEENEFIVFVRQEALEIVPPYYLGGCV